MPRRRSAALTDGELRIMRVLWDSGRATVGEVAERIDASPKPAYNSILTMLRILETKGYVRHEKDGRAFVYAAVIDRGQARRSALSLLLNRFFDGSPELLVLDLLGQDKVTAEDVSRLREMIREARLTATAPATGRRS